MDFIKPAVKVEVEKTFVQFKEKYSETEARAWREIENRLLRGSSRYDTSHFSLIAQVFIGNLIDEILTEHLEQLITHITTPPYSIGEYWLDKQMGVIEVCILKELS